MRDGTTIQKYSRGISPVSTSDNTALVSEILDTAEFDTASFLIQLGSIADADATFVILVEDGDDSGLSDAAAVADVFLIGTEAGAAFLFSDDNKTAKIGYIGPKRYVSVTITPAANASAFLLSGTWIQGHSKKGPQTTQII